MKIILIVIPISLLINGCSLIYSYSGDLPQRVNQWVIEKEYKLALNTINRIDTKHRNYKQLQKQKKKITLYFDNYEKELILKSNKMIEEEKWLSAIRYIDNNINNFPNSQKIIQHKNKLLRQRSVIIASLEKEVLNSHATNLINKIPLYNKINKTVGDDGAYNLNIKKYNTSRIEASKKLVAQGTQQYKLGLIDDAHTSINLAIKLKPNKIIIPHLKPIRKKIKKEIDAAKLIHVTSAKATLDKISQGYSQDILKKAKKSIYWLKTNQEEKDGYAQLISKLEKHFKMGTKQNFKAARRLYSKEKVQEALSIWLSLKELAPNYPKLNSHIKRAKKILAKFKRINKKAKK